MRKIILLFVLLITISMASCQKTSIDDTNISENTDSTNKENIMSDNIYEGVNVQPENQTTYFFNSYDELKKIIDGSNEQANKYMKEDARVYGTLYESTLSALFDKRIALVAPTIKGSIMKLRQKDGFAGISFMTNELYNMPWICYHCEIDGGEIRISISYPCILNNSRVDECKEYADICKIISPDAPSPDNYESFSSYEKIYEDKIILSGGEEVDAIVSSIKNSNKQYVMFYLKGLMVNVCAEADMLTEDFWIDFSISEYK